MKLNRKWISCAILTAALAMQLAGSESHGFGRPRPAPTPTPTHSPTPPPSAALFDVNVEVFSGAASRNARIAGAVVSANGETATTDGNGFAHLTLPYGRHQVTVSAFGYNDWSQSILVDRDFWHVYPSEDRPSLRVELGWNGAIPPKDALRAFKGDISGIRLPEVGGNGILFTAPYAGYPADVRAAMRAAYKARRYTHMPISIAEAGYRGVYPGFDYYGNPAAFRPFLEELWADGLVPVVFMIPDTVPLNGNTANDMRVIRDRLAPFIQDAATMNLIRVAATGWEINGWMSPAVMTESARYVKSILHPEAMLYIHFTAGHAAGSGPGESESGWWASMIGTLQGILYQDDSRDRAAIRDRLADFTLRFQTGYNGWPRGFDVVAFEYSAYWETNHGYPESWGVDLGNAALQTSPPIQGFCDGASAF